MQTLISKTNEFKLYNLILWPDVQSGGGCWYIFLNEFMSEWVSEWVIVDLNANLIFLQLYHGENRLIFNEMMMRSTLY